MDAYFEVFDTMVGIYQMNEENLAKAWMLVNEYDEYRLCIDWHYNKNMPWIYEG